MSTSDFLRIDNTSGAGIIASGERDETNALIKLEPAPGQYPRIVEEFGYHYTMWGQDVFEPDVITDIILDGNGLPAPVWGKAYGIFEGY